MKILHIMNYYQEGMGYQENWLPLFQKKMGHDVKILTSDKYFPFPNYNISIKPLLGERLKGGGCFIDRGIDIIRKKSLFEIASKSIIVFDIVDIANQYNPDVIHLHGITNLNLLQVLYFSWRKKTKLFIDSHSDYQVSNHTSFFNKIYYKVWSILYKLLDSKINLFLPTTKEGKEFLHHEFNINYNRCIINYLGVNIENFYYDENAKKNLEKQYNVKNKIVLVNAGKQYKAKNIDFIIKILKELVTQYDKKNIVLFLIGNATQEYNFLIEQELKNYEDYIVRIPFLKNEELRSYYSLADIGIWPGIPSNTIQEAMACETAIILPSNDTTSHLINNNGFIFNKFDIQDVAKEINKLIENNQLSEYKKQSRIVVEKYSWQQIAKESLHLYENY